MGFRPSCTHLAAVRRTSAVVTGRVHGVSGGEVTAPGPCRVLAEIRASGDVLRRPILPTGGVAAEQRGWRKREMSDDRDPRAERPPVTTTDAGIPAASDVLDRNPENFFAEIEQAAFSPANMVPGIGPSPDRMLLGRLFSYHDTHLHRIGTNYEQLPVNRPRSGVHSYNKDGAMRYADGGHQPVYAPNSYGGPQADPLRFADPGWLVETAEIVRSASARHTEDDDFIQAGNLYRDVMSAT